MEGILIHVFTVKQQIFTDNLYMNFFANMSHLDKISRFKFIIFILKHMWGPSELFLKIIFHYYGMLNFPT